MGLLSSMGLKNRAEKLVSDQLRPWLLSDVFPVIKAGTSGLTVELTNLEFDHDVLNGASMGSSPLVIKEAVKVETVQLIFTPFRQPVVTVVVEGLHLVFVPRSAEDAWWGKKREKTAEQKQIAALFALDPQGAGVHTAAQGFAQGKADQSLKARFFTSLVLSSVRVEFLDCSVRVVSHVDGECQQFCHIPLSSLEFGESHDVEGFTWSGGLLGAVTMAARGVWKRSNAPASKYCFVKGLGLQVGTMSVDGTGQGFRAEASHKESAAAEIDEIAQKYLSGDNSPDNEDVTLVSAPQACSRDISKHVVLLEDLVLGFRFREVGLDALELDAPEVAFALDFEEMHVLQILVAQFSGPDQGSLNRSPNRFSEGEGPSESETSSLSRKGPKELWREATQKVIELSSRRRLAYAIQEGVVRRRYSRLYESWLSEVGWGRKCDEADRVRTKSQTERIEHLSAEISRMQKKLPLEAIALARRIARRRLSASMHWNEDVDIDGNAARRSEHLRNMKSSFGVFLGSFWRLIMVAMFFIQSKASKLSTWVSAVKGLGVSEWKTVRGFQKRVRTDASRKGEPSLVVDDDSQPVDGSVSSSAASDKRTYVQHTSERVIAENYLFLADERQVHESGVLGSEKKKEWAMTYALRIRNGSITVASAANEGPRKRVEGDSRLRDGSLQLETTLVPALHFSLEKLVVAYGSTADATGATIACGSLQCELVSILPSQLPKELSAQLHTEVYQKEYSSLGRWVAKLHDRGLILSSSPCPQRNDVGRQTISELPLVGDMYEKHWVWQGRHLDAWDRSWSQVREEKAVTGDQSTSNARGRWYSKDRPFLVAEYNSLDDEPDTEDSLGGLIKCSLAAGQLIVFLKGSFFERLRLLLDQLTESQTAVDPNHMDAEEEKQRTGQPCMTLEQFWDFNYHKYLDMCREAMVAAIPEKSIRLTAVVEGPQLRLSATATELYDYQQDIYKDLNGRRLKLDPKMEATVVVDVGRLDVVMWPPQKMEPAEIGSRDDGNGSRSSSDWWTRAVESKLWLKRPPLPALPPNFTNRRYWEHEQVGNNLYISIEDLALVLELQSEILRELPVVGPFAMVIETSLCWDRYSSLFSSSKSVSVAIGGKISSLSVQSYIQEVSMMLKVIGFCMEGFKSRLAPESAVVVRGRDTTMTLDVIAQEDPVQSAESNKESAREEVLFTACVLRFSVGLEKLRFVLGDSRREYGCPSISKSADGAQARMQQDAGLRYEPREEKLQSVDEDYETIHNWEPNPVSGDVGKEIYILIQDVSLNTSLGDGEQFCIFTGLKDVLMRLMDTGSVKSTRDLVEIRNHFFSASVTDTRFPSHQSGYKSFSALVVTEVSLELLSLKAFGPSAPPLIDDGYDSSSGSRSVRQQYTENTVDEVQEGNDSRDGSNQDSAGREQSTPHLSAATLPDLELEDGGIRHDDQTSLSARNLGKLSIEDQGRQWFKKANDTDPTKDSMHDLAISVEAGKILVTDGSLDALVAKVVLVANGAESFHLDMGADRCFQSISLDAEGGLVLIHTEAAVTLVHFCEDIGRLVENLAAFNITSLEATRNMSGDPGGAESQESWEIPPSSPSYLSSSVPPASSDKCMKKFKRSSSAPLKSQAPVAKSPVILLPNFEGVVVSKVAGFSLILARHSVSGSVPAEGVLFELDVVAMLELDGRAKRASLDVQRFTILGLQARVPGSAGKNKLRMSSRTPEFGASFKRAPADDVQGSSLPAVQFEESFREGSASGDQGSSFCEEASDADVGGLLRPTEKQPEEVGQYEAASDMPSSSNEEQIAGVENDSDPKGLERLTTITKQAEGFHKALSEFNSFILERLAIYCAFERVDNQDKVWKWTDAWQGQCTVIGLNVAITTSEIQLVESLVNPLASLGGSSKPTAAEKAPDDPVEETKEDPNEEDFELPDGAVIALKDVREHCYLAAEEMPGDKGRYRLVGVLHYTLAGDRALFMVKYQDSGKRSKVGWFSLLSLHAKLPSGESFRVQYNPGSGLAGISSTNDGSWEQWRFVSAESSKYEKRAELDIRKPTFKHLFHLVNQKSKNSIAFEENVPVMVKQPGNPFKVKIVAKPAEASVPLREAALQTDETPLTVPPLDEQEAVAMVTSIPHLVCRFDTFIFTVLHEAAGGLHLLPLLRARIPATEGVVQVGLSKTRTILQCSIVLEYYETHSSLWVPIINPVATDIYYRARDIKHGTTAAVKQKTPVTFFFRFNKVDVVVSEPSLDACLFLIGALDLAGPYTVRYPPVRANRCLVENHTGVDVLCSFDQGSSKLDGMIPSWHSDSFLMRHMTSRRDTGPTKVASSLELYLQRSGKGASSPVLVMLGDPGVIAIRTRLQTEKGRKTTGPMLVVDVSRRNQDGILVTVSPMVRIRNASGRPLELRCRRETQVEAEEGAVVLLEDGDTIDDSMGAFDSLNLEGELKKALSSLNLGNYLLSIRPIEASSTENVAESKRMESTSRYDWSEDVKGAKPVRAAGLFDKLQYNLNKTVKAQNLDSTFGVVFCALKAKPSGRSGGPGVDAGGHFLIRTISRKVPVSRLKTSREQEQHRGRYAVVAWQQQQEFLLLPTVRVLNLMTSNIAILLTSTREGRKEDSASETKELQFNAHIKGGGQECLYMDLGDLVLTVKHEDLDLLSRPVCLGVGSKEFSRNSKGGSVRDLEVELDFRDGMHTALVTVSRGEDGVLEVVVLTRYVLQNDSHVTLLCCSQKHHRSRWGGLRSSKDQQLEWAPSGIVTTIAPNSRSSWFNRSTRILVKRTEPDAQVALLDLDSVSGSMEISLRVRGRDSTDNRVQLGVQLHLPMSGDPSPSCVILLVPRYIVANDSGEAIVVCQDGFQEDSSAMVYLRPGESSAIHAQLLPGQNDEKVSENGEVRPELLLTVRFRPQEAGWNWSGPVCAAALGSFSVKIRRGRLEDTKEGLQKPQKEGLWFAVADVQEKVSSLVMTFRRQTADSVPYRLENALYSASITYNQQGLDNSEILEAGASVGYVWDDLGQPHELVVKVAGTALQRDINPDKLRSWKSFRVSRRKRGPLQIPFLNDLSSMAMYGDDDDDAEPVKEGGSLPPVGYEVYADGPTRVVRICEEKDSRVVRQWQSDVTSPKSEIEVRIPLFTMTLVEPGKQPVETEKEDGASSEAPVYLPIICLRLTNVLLEALITPAYTLCQLKAERLDVDVKWQGAPVAAMLRGHGQDRFGKGHTVLHMAVVMSNRAKNPIQLKYASILLQAMDLNLDEDTLMKLAPFYRYSLSESTAPSLQIYFERFEIHPIKIVGSFLPGNPRADYSSAQETLRALLHSVIKVPTVRGTTVELNGVLLSNALLTFKQLALKCAQHYSWYAMRAIYVARGSKLLPPGFASLFDDSAASSLDVFFDPSNGSIDLQGLTLGMFSVLSRGLRKKGKGGTQRYLGDLQHTVKAAGSNLLFAVITEVSDSVLKGADASGFDGLVSGFRRGILNVAMKPSVLRGAVVQGGSTRRIKLDRIVGTDEAYIEGYLQAMLDALFKQNYLRVKVIDDQVVLKNLPPNTTLMEEIVGCVRNFLIGEGLLSGESSAAALSSLRRLRGEDERRLGPTVIALCEQLLVIIVVRSLRRQTIKVLRQNNINVLGDDQTQKLDPPKEVEEEGPKEQHRGFFQGINVKGAVTGFALSSALAYADGRICRYIPNPLVRRIVSGFLLSFVE